MVKKKKLKDEFKEFRNNDKSALQKLSKIPLKKNFTQSGFSSTSNKQSGFEMNDLMIHSYQFIRLYVLNCYSNKIALPEIDNTFILYCIKSLGTRSNQGVKCKNTELLDKLERFYLEEYQPSVNHEKTNLKTLLFITLFSNTNSYFFIQQRTRTFHSALFEIYQ